MSVDKPVVLCVTDFAASTGFARVAENLLTRVQTTKAFSLGVLALNHWGDPHPLRERFKHIYPAQIGKGDPYGFARVADLVKEARPDLLFIQSDAWLVPIYLDAIRAKKVAVPKVVAYCPPDSMNQPAGARLHDIDHLICPTHFGIDELRSAGYDGPSTVLPYGVDTTIYRPIDQTEARRAMSYPADRLYDFVVGRADRNAQRKRYDLTIEGFAKFYVDAGCPADVTLHLHCAMKDIGVDILQLAQFWERRLQVAPGTIESRILYPKDLVVGRGIEEARMPYLYNCWNAHISPAMGEGGGLVSLESAACGVGQYLVECAAGAEWFKDVAEFLPVIGYHATCGGGVNTLGAVTSAEAVAAAHHAAYEDWKAQDTLLGRQARSRVTDGTFDWDTLAERLAQVWKETLA